MLVACKIVTEAYLQHLNNIEGLLYVNISNILIKSHVIYTQ
jgi:hypothetical protein